jgi:hypothetical protein
MGIRFFCPNGHKLNVKDFQAGRRGICPFCGAKIQIPTQSTRPSSKRTEEKTNRRPVAATERGETTASSAPATNVAAPAVAVAAESVVAAYATPPGAASAQPGQAAVAGAAAPGLAGPSGEVPMAADVPAGVAAETPETPAVVPVADGASDGLEYPAVPAVSAPAPAGAPADPITEAPEMIWYVRPPSGGQFGPATGDVMRTWLAEGRVSVDSLVWREGWRDWQGAGVVFPQLQADPTMAFLGSVADSDAITPLTTMHMGPSKTRRQASSTQFTIIGLLAVAVIILFAIFLWVLLQ